MGCVAQHTRLRSLHPSLCLPAHPGSIPCSHVYAVVCVQPVCLFVVVEHNYALSLCYCPSICPSHTRLSNFDTHPASILLLKLRQLPTVKVPIPAGVLMFIDRCSLLILLTSECCSLLRSNVYTTSFRLSSLSCSVAFMPCNSCTQRSAVKARTSDDDSSIRLA